MSSSSPHQSLTSMPPPFMAFVRVAHDAKTTRIEEPPSFMSLIRAEPKSSCGTWAWDRLQHNPGWLTVLARLVGFNARNKPQMLLDLGDKNYILLLWEQEEIFHEEDLIGIPIIRIATSIQVVPKGQGLLVQAAGAKNKTSNTGRLNRNPLLIEPSVDLWPAVWYHAGCPTDISRDHEVVIFLHLVSRLQWGGMETRYIPTNFCAYSVKESSRDLNQMQLTHVPSLQRLASRVADFIALGTVSNNDCAVSVASSLTRHSSHSRKKKKKMRRSSGSSSDPDGEDDNQDKKPAAKRSKDSGSLKRTSGSNDRKETEVRKNKKTETVAFKKKNDKPAKKQPEPTIAIDDSSSSSSSSDDDSSSDHRKVDTDDDDDEPVVKKKRGRPPKEVVGDGDDVVKKKHGRPPKDAADAAEPVVKRKPGRPPNKDKKKKDPNQPKRGVSAYFLFRNDHQGKLRKENPGIGLKELSTILSSQWKDLPQFEKQVYLDRSTADRERYHHQMEAYKKQQQQPRNIDKSDDDSSD